ncbi:MAG: thioesterase family protein [Acidocella sp.]|nr:thioesterase family protein [Acidocella sp.]
MTALTDFPGQTYDKLRYGDTDRQGHINNAVFTSLYETGRVSILHHEGQKLAALDHSFVLARIAIDYRAEMFWPGLVQIGTGVKLVGTSSITFAQALFQDGKCVSTAESVVVQVNAETRRAAPISPAARDKLASLIIAFYTNPRRQ